MIAMLTKAFLSSVIMLVVLSTFPFAAIVYQQTPVYVELKDYRWNRFPLKVLVNMDQWSVPSYASAVREALDSWMRSVWNFSNSFDETSLPAMGYLLYLTGVNATQNYDVVVSFTADNIPPDSNTVGVTEGRWDLLRHEPIPPINITVTTFSGTASDLSVKNVVMHEFGHALGLGHASVPQTSNGPELMYHVSTREQTVYPSTLDLYGLAELYRGGFASTVYLPADIPYIMLAEGAVVPPPPSQKDYWKSLQQYAPVLVLVVLVVVAVVVVVGWINFEKRSRENMGQSEC
jgi:hypothetical protein